MQKLLLGGALSVLTLYAGAIQAQDFKVTLSGDAEFQGTFGSQDKDKNTRSVDFRNRFRFTVNPEAIGLNGALTYGAKVRVKAESNSGSATFDRAYTYVKGAFGTVMGGNNTTYNDDVAVGAPGDWRPESDVALAFVNSGNSYSSARSDLEAWRLDTLDPTGSNTNVRYQSPFISGVQVGVGFTPNSGSDGLDSSTASGWTFNRSKAGLTNAYEVGLLFDSSDKSIADKFGAAVLRASFAYMGGEVKSSGLISRKDLQAFQAGIQGGYAGFTLGGGLVYQGKSGLASDDGKAVNAYSWRVGAQYQTGPLAFGVGYDYAQKDVDLGAATTRVGDTGQKKTSQQIGAGLNYTVAKGLDVAAEYDYVKTKNTFSDISDKANVVTVSTKLAF